LSGDGVRLSPDIRGAFRKLAKKDLTVTGIAQLFSTTRQTVYRWLGRGRHWFLVCIDDYSRFIVCAEQFEHELTTAEVTAVLERQRRLPRAILSDHGQQFKEQ
jgi:transposase InsO family protein